MNFTGYDGEERQSAAIAIDPVAIKGMKITSIYAVGFENTNDFGNLRFWGSTVLNHDHNLVEAASNPIVDGKGEAFLETPVTVPDETFL